MNSLFLEFFANRTKEGDSITNLGNGEIQTYEEGNLPTNYVFTEDNLKESLDRLKSEYLEIEKKHWEECGRPNKHLYLDWLTLLKALD